MADRLRIFVSSRVADAMPAGRRGERALKLVRHEIREKLRTAFDGRTTEVLLNEEEPAETDLDAVERCERWARDAHLVVAIITGHPGSMTPRGLGICHLELKTAMEDCPQKVIIIKLDGATTERNFAAQPEFKQYFKDIWSAWRKFGATAKTAEEVVEQTVKAVGQAVARMASLSLREWRRRPGVEGEAFDWAAKTYSERAHLLVRDVIEGLKASQTTGMRVSVIREPDDLRHGLLDLRINGTTLRTTVSGVPDGFGVPDARKYCGYPFREDGAHLGQGKAEGPIHLVAVYKRVTEGQIRTHLGNADIAILKTRFGYFSQDRSQAIQVAYFVEIEDGSRARQRSAEFVEWVEQERYFQGIRELGIRRAQMVRPPITDQPTTRHGRRPR